MAVTSTKQVHKKSNCVEFRENLYFTARCHRITHVECFPRHIKLPWQEQMESHFWQNLLVYDNEVYIKGTQRCTYHICRKTNYTYQKFHFNSEGGDVDTEGTISDLFNT